VYPTNDELLKALQDSSGESLVCDDNGRWAVTVNGFQNITDPNTGMFITDGPIELNTVFNIKAEEWCNSIREALLKWYNEK